ncbi:MAG: gamma-glutamyl-gamma-aminobutyrate hydrolase family protein [Intestinimonas sp.]|jgi:putative glutamine amidotransferase|nr:gamma-glutamyl-gamma-aminobutyrate hydrolase family protein [Intestinimonas sp.]
MASSPRILISGSDEGRANYETAVAQLGGTPCSFYCPPCNMDYDGLLLCGGDDIDPIRFGQENKGSEGIDPARDQAELVLTSAYVAAGKPILGICRGHQLLNVALGGSLLQDISPQLRLFHTHDPIADVDKVHPVRASEGSLLHTLYGPVFSVNSAHHQALDRLGEGLVAVQWSESGIVEGIQHKSLPIIGVQFHPERMCCRNLRADTVDGAFLFRHFLDLCRKYAHG